MKKSIIFSALVTNFVSYGGRSDTFEEVDFKLRRPVPETVFYDDAYEFFNGELFRSTADLPCTRRESLFVHFFSRSFGLDAWFFHRKQLACIARVLYQRILYEREMSDRIPVAEFDSISLDAPTVYDDDEFT